MDGKVLALNAFNGGPGSFRQVLDNNNNLINVRGDVLWGWQTLGEQVFASPAVANNWMYVASDDGIIYAFSPTGGYLTPGEPPGGELIDAALSPNLQNLRVEVFSAEEYRDIVQRRTRTPEQVLADGHTRKVGYEWGDTVYVIAFGMQGLAPPARSVTLTLRSRAATVNRTVGVVPYGTDTGDGTEMDGISRLPHHSHSGRRCLDTGRTLHGSGTGHLHDHLCRRSTDCNHDVRAHTRAVLRVHYRPSAGSAYPEPGWYGQ
jgi:hypothetical protein